MKVQALPTWVDHKSLQATKAHLNHGPDQTKGKERCLNMKSTVNIDHPDESDLDVLPHSLDSEFGVPIMGTLGVNKAFTLTNNKLRLSSREKNRVTRFGYNEYMAHHYAFMIKVGAEREPYNFTKAAPKPRWMQCMDEEMQPLVDNETWDLVASPPQKKVIGCRWIYKIKHHVDSSIRWYKDRLVGKGYAQTHAIDYEEILAPTAKMTGLFELFDLMAANRWHLHRMDVKNVFLQGELEEVYTVQPPGFKSKSHLNVVFRLKKPLYGLKQPPRAWLSKTTQFLHWIYFWMSTSDNSLFIWNNSSGRNFIIIYIDDLVIGGNQLADINKVKMLLSRKFEMKDISELHYFLGIKVIRTGNDIMVSQCHYIFNLLFKFSMGDHKPISTPLSRNLKLHADFGTPCELAQYRQIIGSLIYLTITRPGLSYPIALLS